MYYISNLFYLETFIYLFFSVLEKLCVGDENGELHYISVTDKNYFFLEQSSASETSIQQGSSKSVPDSPSR